MVFENVSVISHADWSINPKKRWMYVANKQSDRHWYVHQPTLLTYPSKTFQYLASQFSGSVCILSELDFPIGLPYSYASKAGLSDFLSTLPLFGHDKWNLFYTPSEIPSDTSIYHPFYPNKPGGSNRQHLEYGLNIPFHYLYRLRETAHEIDVLHAHFSRLLAVNRSVKLQSMVGNH
jgi:hypothetical protein